MPDWRQLVRRRLGSLGLRPEREAEIIAELADHLEDCFDSRRVPRVPGEVADWEELAAEIRRAEEGDMNERTKNFWVPGMASLFVSSILLMFISRVGPQPQAIWISSNVPPLLFYVPWLILLPVCGALGAYWSKRAGGGASVRMMAAMFPVLALAALFVVIGMPVALAADRIPLDVFFRAFSYAFLGWVIIPGAALFLGALPFLRNPAHKSA